MGTERNFNPRPPCGGRHIGGCAVVRGFHFNPRPPCGGRHIDVYKNVIKDTISIHVPRVEDDVRIKKFICINFISIHVPRVEDDKYMHSPHIKETTFQSTSPVWRTTIYSNILSRFYLISIHVPRVEDDVLLCMMQILTRIFQSTSPVWRTTNKYKNEKYKRQNFNPRPPCGGRRAWTDSKGKMHKISIDVPRVEDDKINTGGCKNAKNFNPRPPCGGRRTA